MYDYNGSPTHRRYKHKVANVLRSYGFQVAGDFDDEFAVERGTDAFPYYVDLCASDGTRVIVVEIDGHRGHSSRRNMVHDKNRTVEITSLIASVEVFRFAFWQLVRCPDNLIAEELRLTRTDSSVVAVSSSTISQPVITHEKARCIR